MVGKIVATDLSESACGMLPCFLALLHCLLGRVLHVQVLCCVGGQFQRACLAAARQARLALDRQLIRITLALAHLVGESDSGPRPG